MDGKMVGGKSVGWRAFFSGYEAADWPIGLFYKDIIRAHPEAEDGQDNEVRQPLNTTAARAHRR